MPDTARADLARQMMRTLPAFGNWANSFRDFETPYGKVGFRQLAILWILRHGLIPEEDISPSRLATYHRVQPSVVTRALDKLEAGGFIVRSVHPADGRRFRITMTAKGREVSEFVERLYVEDMIDSMAFLDDAGIDDLQRNVSTLARIVDDLERRRLERGTRLVVTSDG